MPTPKDSFKAEGQNAGEFLSRNGEYFYVPVYQRSFTWNTKEDISRLYWDVAEGVVELTGPRGVDALIFIGAMILVEDRDKQQVNPKVRDQVPSRVSVVIDGQQRCTALLIWAAALIDQLYYQVRRLKNRSKDAGWKELIATANKTIKSLGLMIHDDEGGTDPAAAYYPRMIRAGDDQWSTRPSEARYGSPIGRFLRHASEWLRNNSEGRLLYSDKNFTTQELERHGPVCAAFKFFRTRCQEFADGPDDTKPDSFRPPTAKDMASSVHFQEALWGNPWSETVRTAITRPELGSKSEQSALVSVARMIALANFVLSRVCFTVVRSDLEDRAFDMFDALNTTGQPLTAFETFRPIVIENVTLKDYRDSEEFKLLTEIDDYLQTAPSEKVKRTEKLVIHARLHEFGEKLSKRLGVQRPWLKKHYETLGTPQKLEFLRDLACLAKFTGVFFNYRQHRTLCGDSATALSLAHLAETKHDIVIPLLTRFFARATISGDGASTHAALEDFRRVVRATVAFSTLWRLARGGTAGIDDCFRSIMRGTELAPSKDRIGPFCAQAHTPRPLQATEYISDLNACLRNAGIGSENEWVKSTDRRPVYEESREFVRLFLAAAMHDSIPDPLRTGCLKRGASASCRMLAEDAIWRDFDYQIEHIAPQTPIPGDWPSDVYEDREVPHSLGNLTLLPSNVNTAIRNWSWTKKRAVMQIMSEEDKSTAARLQSEFTESAAIPEFPTLEKIVNDAPYHKYLTPICTTTVWTRSSIETRGRNLCELGYRRLTEWLV